MKIKHYIAVMLVGIAALTACNNEPVPTYTVGADDNAIVLAAGISEGGTGVITRAYNPEANHSSHLKFTQGTALTLRVDGVWKGKADGTVPHGTITSTVVSLKTNATIGDDITVNSEGSATHNKVTFTPAQQLYWDDYGSADPANMSTEKGGTVGDGTDGRGRGLDIFAVAVNAVTTAPEVSSWTALPWSVEANQTGGWSAKDLLTSNNVKKTNNEDTNNPYKFDDRASGKLLEFTHAMTKVTVELTAGEGFPGYATDPANATFVQAPTVTLLGFNYTGTVNVETKTSTPTTDTKTNIKAHLASGGVGQHTASFEALVFPGNTITNVTTDYILELNADGNVLKVSGAKLYEKMTSLSHGYVLKDGVNYILNIKVNKTGIDVTATIKNWVDVSTEQETPIIGFSQCYGQTTGGGLSDFAKGFTFYRSTAVGGSYLEDGNKADVTYATSTYTMSPQLYWPDHSTHYFFRGIWPEVNNESGKTPTAKVVSNGILVENCNYTANTYPTDLMIGMPRKADGTADETCKVDAHKTGEPATAPSGICATDAVSAAHPNEGLIHMNFQYAMSQVIVKLTTNEASGAKDNITFNEHTKVEIVDCYTGGKILLSDGASDFTGKTITDFTMSKDNNITGALTNQYANYRNVVIPQNLTNGTGAEAKDLKFRITVGNGTLNDVYETVLGIKNIQVQEGSGDPKSITAWEPGKRYTYTLYVTKTDIKVTATLKNWIEVTASEEVWF